MQINGTDNYNVVNLSLVIFFMMFSFASFINTTKSYEIQNALIIYEHAPQLVKCWEVRSQSGLIGGELLL